MPTFGFHFLKHMWIYKIEEHTKGLLGGVWTQRRIVEVRIGVEHFLTPNIMNIKISRLAESQQFNLLVKIGKNTCRDLLVRMV